MKRIVAAFGILILTLSLCGSLGAQERTGVNLIGPNPLTRTPPDLVLDGLTGAPEGPEEGDESSVAKILAVDGPFQLPISWAAFVPVGGVADGDYTSGWVGYISSNVTSAVCFGAQVALPHGAVVDSVSAYAIDNSATENIGFYLYRQQIGTSNLASWMADFTSTSSSSSLRIFLDLSVTEPIIDNYNYQYYAYFCLTEPQHTLYTMYIVYNHSSCQLCGGHME